MEKVFNKVIEGDKEGVRETVQEALDAGQDPQQLINEGLIKAMDEVGTRMKNGDMFVPEVLVSADAMKGGLEILNEVLGEQRQSKGKILLGTVAGDLHDIGKNLVGMMLESVGFEVVDLGIDVPTEDFVEAVKEHQPHILGLSALLTTTMQAMKDAVEALKSNGHDVKVVVGGAPINQSFADQIGADGYAPDAARAVDLCNELLHN